MPFCSRYVNTLINKKETYIERFWKRVQVSDIVVYAHCVISTRNRTGRASPTHYCMWTRPYLRQLLTQCAMAFIVIELFSRWNLFRLNVVENSCKRHRNAFIVNQASKTSFPWAPFGLLLQAYLGATFRKSMRMSIIKMEITQVCGIGNSFTSIFIFVTVINNWYYTYY